MTGRPDERAEAEPADTVDAARREALARLGGYAAYTAPAMIALLVADRAVARTCRGIAPPPECTVPNPGNPPGPPGPPEP